MVFLWNNITGDIMITSYEIRKVDNEEVLILYFNYKFEFAKDGSKDEPFLDKINNFLKANKVKFNGTKAVLVVGSLVFGSVILAGNNQVKTQTPVYNYVSQMIINEYDPDGILESYYKIKINEEKKKQEEIKNEKNDTDTATNKVIISEPKQETVVQNNNVIEEESNHLDNQKKEEEKDKSKEIIVTVNRSNGTTVELELEEYIVGVVAKEMPASFNKEALKAQAIAARTYALRLIKEGKKLTDTVSTQAYMDTNEMKAMWKNDFDYYYNKIKDAVNETKDLVMTYNNEYIYAIYHSTSNGYTESAFNVFGYDYPYLQTVESKWDLNASSYEKEKTIDFETLSKFLGFDFNINSIIEIKRNDYGRIETVAVDEHYYSGIEFRNLLGLRSTDFDIVNNDGFIKITTKGYGHGVGMSQYGANGMAKEGYNYENILHHYYKNISITSLRK